MFFFCIFIPLSVLHAICLYGYSSFLNKTLTMNMQIKLARAGGSGFEEEIDFSSFMF